MKNVTIIVFTIALLYSLSCAAVAEDGEPVRERWEVKAGTFFIRDADTVIRLDAANGLIGTTIDFNQTLGIEDDDITSQLQGYWRFNNHHSIRADWYNIRRGGLRNIDIDINFGDKFFQANTDVTTKFNTQIFDVMYQYSFYNTEEVELAVQGGFHTTRIEVGLDAPGIAGGGITQSASATAPLPVFGFAARYNFLPKLSVNFSWKTLELDFGDFGGSFRDTSLVAEHRTFKHVGFGFGIQRFNFNVEATKDQFSGSFDNRWEGIYLYLMGYSP